MAEALEYQNVADMSNSYPAVKNYSSGFGNISTYEKSSQDSKNSYSLNRIPGIDLEFVPTYKLQNNKDVLGMAFPKAGLVQILQDLNVKQKLEVLIHEVNHINEPENSERQTRKKTADILKLMDMSPSFHNDDYLDTHI